MSIFTRIKDAIFNRNAPPGSASASTPKAPANRPSSPSASGTGVGQSTATASPRPQAPPQSQPVNVEAVLEERAAKNPQKLNWRTSIVDLMKLLDLDPTLENRKELAKELGYTGDTADSATMNIWLHKQVMIKLAQSGGTVPDSLK